MQWLWPRNKDQYQFFAKFACDNLLKKGGSVYIYSFHILKILIEKVHYQDIYEKIAQKIIPILIEDSYFEYRFWAFSLLKALLKVGYKGFTVKEIKDFVKKGMQDKQHAVQAIAASFIFGCKSEDGSFYTFFRCGSDFIEIHLKIYKKALFSHLKEVYFNSNYYCEYSDFCEWIVPVCRNYLTS